LTQTDATCPAEELGGSFRSARCTFLVIAGTGISADSVLARAQSVLGGGSSGSSVIDNLAINGVPVAMTGAPNQTISIPRGQVVINEQTVSASGITVNALHAKVSGLFGPWPAVVVSTRFLAGGNMQLHKPNPSTTGSNPLPDELTACHMSGDDMGF